MIVSENIRTGDMPAGGASAALGMFDGLHLGHCAVIRAAVREAERRGCSPCVFTFFPEKVGPKSKDGATQLLSQKRGERILAELGVRYVLRPPFESFCHLSPEAFVREVLRERLGAEHLVCGEDFAFGKGAAAHAGHLRELAAPLGMTVEVVPTVLLEGVPVSSTRIRACIEAGEISAANRMLGRPFAVDTAVVHGNRLGRTLNFPTINQPFPENFTIPRRGVYASLAFVEGRWQGAVTNVGVKPTVGGGQILAETYIHGFAGNLYGQEIEVRFLEFIRPERKFASLEELRAAIRSDAERAAAIAAPFLPDIAESKLV